MITGPGGGVAMSHGAIVCGDSGKGGDRAGKGI